MDDKVGTWDGGGTPSWIREDGSHDAVAHTAALNKYSSDALKYKRPVPPEKGTKNRERHDYTPHPEGTARERYKKSGSTMLFTEWCYSTGLAKRHPQ